VEEGVYELQSNFWRTYRKEKRSDVVKQYCAKRVRLIQLLEIRRSCWMDTTRFGITFCL
jgi:hypothetical protein